MERYIAEYSTILRSVIFHPHRPNRRTDKVPAVKCNPDGKLLQLLADMDVNFDCASIGEIEQVLDMGIDPSRIVFAHPCKAPSALDTAARRGIRWTTFDNFDELDKIWRISPELELLLRIYVQDKTAKVALGDKFGAPIEIARTLLQKARRLELKVVGVCFHIGIYGSFSFHSALHLVFLCLCE